MLDQGAGKEMLRGSLLALTTDVLFDSEVMNLIRDLLKFQPPIAGTPEVSSTHIFLFHVFNLCHLPL